MALMMQIPQFSPLNIPAPTPRVRSAPQPGQPQGGGLLDQLMRMPGGTGGIPGAPAGAGMSAAGGGAAGGLSMVELARTLASLGMGLPF